LAHHEGAGYESAEVQHEVAAEPKIGHNSLDKDRLRDIVSRIESIGAERTELASDVKDIFAEAKGQGFDVAALRTIIKMRKQEPAERDARQALIDEYMQALQGLADLPLGRAALVRDELCRRSNRAGRMPGTAHTCYSRK
jgi:uncharacterized protein (UPF0335 family)